MAKTSNQDFYDALIRHHIYLSRYGSYVRNRILKVLNDTESEISLRIREKLLDKTGLTTPSDWRRLKSLIENLNVVRADAWDKALNSWSQDSVSLSQQEPHIMAALTVASLPVVLDVSMPSDPMLRSIALARPFQGKVLKDWAATMQADDIRRISNAVQGGMIAGEDSSTIARRVVGRALLKGSDGVTEMTRRQVEAVVRTAISHIANHARMEFVHLNSDIISEEQFVATLDSGTTMICASLDGKIFKLGKGPIAPLHFRCRSLRIAAFNGERIGERPANPTTQKILLQEFADKQKLGTVTSRDHLPHGTKGLFDSFSRKRIRELVGPVPARTTYQAWLTRQSTAFQDDVLGIAKGKLFRDGGLPLSKFVDTAGKELNLRQLAETHADAFKKAGVNIPGTP